MHCVARDAWATLRLRVLARPHTVSCWPPYFLSGLFRSATNHDTTGASSPPVSTYRRGPAHTTWYCAHRTEQNRKRRCCNRYPRPGTAPSSTTGRRSSYRHLLGRPRVCRSLTQSVRESDCWFGAWHEATHSYPQHAQPRQWKNPRCELRSQIKPPRVTRTTRIPRHPSLCACHW